VCFTESALCRPTTPYSQSAAHLPVGVLWVLCTINALNCLSSAVRYAASTLAAWQRVDKRQCASKLSGMRFGTGYLLLPGVLLHSQASSRSRAVTHRLNCRKDRKSGSPPSPHVSVRMIGDFPGRGILALAKQTASCFLLSIISKRPSLLLPAPSNKTKDQYFEPIADQLSHFPSPHICYSNIVHTTMLIALGFSCVNHKQTLTMIFGFSCVHVMMTRRRIPMHT